MTDGNPSAASRPHSHRLIESLRGRARALLVRGLTHGIPFTRIARGADEPDLQPVVMCLWNRPERLVSIVALMEAQIGSPSLRLVLWNNRRAHAHEYREFVRSWSPGGSLARVELVQSPVNIGGIARFLVMRDLRRRGYRGAAITLDDDQDVPPQFIAELLGRAGARTIAGVWAFRHAGGYWTREELGDGERADYVGTGGAVIDTEIVESQGFFSKIPRRYLFLEDMWASAVARDAGWRLSKASIPFSFVLEERNQYHHLMVLKEEFYIFLAHQSQSRTEGPT